MLLLPVLGARRLAAQISPGPLSRAHQTLEGARNCTQCHGAGKDAMNAQCVSCHKEIGWAQQQRRGYHASPAVKAERCASCHPDHAGVDFDLVKWPDGNRDRFDHARTGWTLERSHATTRCADCHSSKLQDASVTRLAPAGTGPAWIGLKADCTSCHEDEHRGALGESCTTCHDAGKWTTTPGFQHDTTSYPLTDKHREVACDMCHLSARLAPKRNAAGQLVPVYRPVPATTCASCHADPHHGGLGGDCASCHTTRGFRIVDRKRFDHQRTRYPLTGKHATVRCAACHQDFGTAVEKKPAFAACTSCHADAHKGSATLAGQRVDCASCHTVAGFVPASFTVTQHGNSKFPLEGKHRTTACGACHTKEAGTAATTRWGTAQVVLRPVATTCRSCHADDHGTQFATRADRGECATCHTVKGWLPSTFDGAAHATTRLPLTARHAAVSCKACHATDRPGLPPVSTTVSTGKVKLLFRIPETQCAQCHQDVHRGRFATAHDSVAALTCSDCHEARSFRPSSMDVARHRGTVFPLEGAHRATTCVACHEGLGSRRERTTALVRLAALPALSLQAKTRCSDCHATPHGDQLDGRADRGRCDACHDVAGFAPAAHFDHNRDAKFSLKGAHERVPCARCHATDLRSGTPRGLLFRPLSDRCESCHTGKVTR
ncbi:MAG: hypothetical protein ABI587_13100 [Gemmatimonadales bacterium]